MKKKERGRPAGKPLNRRELEARRANLERARSAPQDLIYRPTAKRMAACLKNLRKAFAARRSQEGSARVRLNALRHGVFSRELIDESVHRLGESEAEFADHRELFNRLLVPQTEEEAVIVWELSNLAWRRLRLFRAAAERERRDLRRLLLGYPRPAPLGARQTRERMEMLFLTLDNCDRVVQDAAKLSFEMEEFCATLVAGRAPPDASLLLAAGFQSPDEDVRAASLTAWQPPGEEDRLPGEIAAGEEPGEPQADAPQAPLAPEIEFDPETGGPE